MAPKLPRQEQLNLFFADLVDPNLRDQQDTMAFPFFSLEKNKRTKPITYEKNGVSVEIDGLTKTGIATIWDADFLIWAASQINEAINQGETPSQRLWVIPYQFMVQTKRLKDGEKGSRQYKLFMAMLNRLQGTSIQTNIPAGRGVIRERWSWLDKWKAHLDDKGRIIGIEVVLSQWLFDRVVKDKAILSISPEYFLLTGGIERWLYRIARKHCGSNDAWKFTVEALFEKYPPGRELRFFKRDLKAVVESDCLPEYTTTWHTVEVRKGQEYVIFMPRPGSRRDRELPRSCRGLLPVDNSD